MPNDKGEAEDELDQGATRSRGIFAAVGLSAFINGLMLTVPLYMLQDLWTARSAASTHDADTGQMLLALECWELARSRVLSDRRQAGTAVL